MATVDRLHTAEGNVLRSIDHCDLTAASASASAPASPSPPQDTTREDSPKTQSLERRNTSSHDVDEEPVQTPTSQSDVMEKDIQPWSPPLPSIDCEGEDFQPHYGAPSPSALQGTSPSIHGENQIQSFSSEYHPYDLPPVATSSEPDTSIKGEESFDPNDPTIDLFHPVPRLPSLLIASRNMAMFPDTFPDAKIEFDSTSLFPSPEDSNECLFNDGIIPKPEWMMDVGTAPLFNDLLPRMPVDTLVGTSVTSMNDTCSPDSSLSWSSLGYQTGFGMQQQHHHQQQQALINHNEVLCSNGPELFTTPNDHYDNINTGYDQTAPTGTATNDFHGLTLLNLNNETQSHLYLPPPVPVPVHMNLNPCRPEYTNLPSPRDPAPALLNSNPSPFYDPADTFTYQESLFQLDQLTHPQPRFTLTTTTTSHLRPQLLGTGTRPSRCPGEARNAFLIECKRHGLSYKDIKRLGGFKEAESTLRGRFRNLTKSKDQRVRKPQWHDKDVSFPLPLPRAPDRHQGLTCKQDQTSLRSREPLFGDREGLPPLPRSQLWSSTQPDHRAA
ncbi:uncharacterized protein KD926_008476 [Aspergillus affinis]|uniref:uncharacterized protein n=1 Tax=Aspergillus affinis TaxID=1070780 RepID=UPI0022FDE734|nr:uncharacterized protein KD926_008476 [Aspergillus affinis]KAI9040153.1 hypothetical protein KD926_008476 [Aspergillus affinis]